MIPQREHRQSIDRSSHSILAVCTCGWRDLVFDQITAWEKAASHASRVHGDAHSANGALHKARIREKEYA